jgi:hypothetical protein
MALSIVEEHSPPFDVAFPMVEGRPILKTFATAPGMKKF